MEPAVIFDPNVTAETSAQLARLPYEPFSASPYSFQDDAELAHNGERIGILIVIKRDLLVLKRITPNGTTSKRSRCSRCQPDATFELAVGMKPRGCCPKQALNRRNLGYGGNQKGESLFHDSRFRYCVRLHGDGQYAPEILSHLYRVTRGDADAVFGSA
jgi:hypothetical protein